MTMKTYYLTLYPTSPQDMQTIARELVRNETETHVIIADNRGIQALAKQRKTANDLFDRYTEQYPEMGAETGAMELPASWTKEYSSRFYNPESPSYPQWLTK
jgi:hypothetical protein